MPAPALVTMQTVTHAQLGMPRAAMETTMPLGPTVEFFGIFSTQVREVKKVVPRELPAFALLPFSWVVLEHKPVIQLTTLSAQLAPPAQEIPAACTDPLKKRNIFSRDHRDLLASCFASRQMHQ